VHSITTWKQFRKTPKRVSHDTRANEIIVAFPFLPTTPFPLSTFSQIETSQLPTHLSITKTQNTMKVKELRSWLTEFGDKHKRHHKRGQCNGQPQIEMTNHDDDMLVIQTKPSNASTSPTSSAGSVSSGEDDPLCMSLSPASTVVQTTLDADKTDRPNDLDQQADESCYSDPSFSWCSEDDSSFEVDDEEDQVMTKSSNEQDEDFSRRVTFGGIQGMNTMGSHTMESVFNKRASLAVPLNRNTSTTAYSLDVAAGNENTDGQSDLKPTRPVFRKKVDPKDLAFLQSKSQTMPKSTISVSNKIPKSGVGAAIQMFGGHGGRKTNIEKRKDELERQWSESRSVTHVKKTKWCVCQKTGVFKKRIVVEAETKIH
jgi:hypothetical protein